MTRGINILKAIHFEEPEYIPMTFAVNGACWNYYDNNQLQDLMEEHSFLFPNFKRQEKVTPSFGLCARKDEPYTDPWGCVWETTEDGIVGSVHQHPLETWDSFDDYIPPDPENTNGTTPTDWGNTRKRVSETKEKGGFVHAGLPHGHTFLRLQDIRGYENLIFDMMDENPKLLKLIEMVEEFNYKYVMKWMELKPDMMGYPEDLGMQVGPMLSPDCFRKYIKPSYQRIMKPARDNGCIVHMHSDGDIRTLVDDIIDGGVEVINLQDLVNGIDWIADKFAGKTCIDLDIDRQLITAQGTPQQIDDLIKEEVEKLGSKKGGLMMIFGLYPGTPIENVKALMDAMEKYATYYSG
jgi:uroporphyrinogen decarboxylase